MAKVAFSAEIQDVRGKVGNTVYSKARNGATMRARVGVKNPRTEAQTSVRANLARAATEYKNLTPEQAQAWALYAAGLTRRDSVTGTLYSPAPNTVFTGLASKFLQVNPEGTVPVTPPACSFSGDAIALTAAGAAGSVTFTASGPDTENVVTELLLQPLASQNRTPSPGGYRNSAFVAFETGSLEFSVDAPAGFYVPAYRFVDTTTGQDTPMIVLPTIGVP